jgi:hypothetical protein
MNHPIIITLVLFLVSGLSAVANDKPAIAAWVNGKAIEERAVLDKMQPVIERLQKRQSAPLNDAVRAQVHSKALHLLIEHEAVLASSLAKRLAVTDEDVEKHLADVASDKAFGSLARYQAYLESQGTPWEPWRAALKDSLLISRLKEDIAKSCPAPTPSEMKSLYEQQRGRFYSGARVKVSLIVLNPDDAEGGNIRRFATGVQNLVFDAGGEAWDDCVAKFSAGPNAENGGHWDWTAPSQLPVGLGKTTAHMKPGDIEKIFHGDYAYFLRLDEIEPKTQLSFEDAREKVDATIMQRKAAAAWTAWVKSETNKAVIKIGPREE